MKITRNVVEMEERLERERTKGIVRYHSTRV
jgi:hypothetical protein